MEQTPGDTWIMNQLRTTPYEVVERDNGGPATELYNAAPEEFRQSDDMAVYFLELFISTASEAANLDADMAELEDKLTNVLNFGVHWYRPESSNRCLVGYEEGEELSFVGELSTRVTAQKLVGRSQPYEMPIKKPSSKKKGPGPSRGRGGRKLGKSNLGGPVIMDIGDEPGIS